jgi:opacity protein-like surface antigen
MNKTLLNTSVALVFGAVSFASTANDDMYFGGGLAVTELSEEGDEVSLNVIHARVGKFFNENISLEARAGFGVGDDDIDGIKVELSNYYGVYLRGGFPVNETLYPYAVLGYTRGKIKASYGGDSISSSESDTSFGLGVDIKLNEKAAINLEYLNYIDKDGAVLDGFSIGISSTF